MRYNLFLDDQRNPEDARLENYSKGRESTQKIITEYPSLIDVSGIAPDDWVVVRDYDEFVFVIETKGIPDVVSLDHDLHYEHIKHYFTVTQDSGIIEYANMHHKTGKHCAEYLVEKIKREKAALPTTFIHSANVFGAEQIKKVLGTLI